VAGSGAEYLLGARSLTGTSSVNIAGAGLRS